MNDAPWRRTEDKARSKLRNIARVLFIYVTFAVQVYSCGYFREINQGSWEGEICEQDPLETANLLEGTLKQQLDGL